MPAKPFEAEDARGSGAASVWAQVWMRRRVRMVNDAV
jgi:hypothetical protein